jgi:transposase
MQTLWIGIDVSKLEFQACALLGGGNNREAAFANNRKGQEQFSNWLERLGQGYELKVCMESTGSYHNALAVHLCQEGIWVAVLNPRTLKHFAISLGTRNKNDKVDARVIARFGLERDPKPWSLANPVRREICQTLAHMERLAKTINIHSNPLEDQALCDSVVSSTSQVLECLQEAHAQAQARIQELVEMDQTLSKVVQAVEKVKGVGKATAIQFAARVDVEAFESAEQAAAFAGLNPCQRQSGKCLNKTVLSKQGDAALRTAFYFPGIAASRYHPKVKALKERLRAKNKRWSAIRAACMRKLLMICFGVAKRALKGLQPTYDT